jgi:hypothetical protein
VLLEPSVLTSRLVREIEFVAGAKRRHRVVIS